MAIFYKNINDHRRQSWVEETLSELPSNSRILDVGAGEIKNKKFCAHLEYTSQDFCQYDGAGDGLGLQTNEWNTSKIDIVSDITEIPVDNNSFDYIVCTEVFEHIKYPVEALQEFQRILKPGGSVIITAPFCSITHMAPYHMYSGFNQYWYQEVMTDKGFTNIEIEANGNWFEYMIQESHRLPFMAKTYSGSKLSVLYKAAILPMLLLLKYLNKKQKFSEELLCFGFQVIAKKNK